MKRVLSFIVPVLAAMLFLGGSVMADITGGKSTDDSLDTSKQCIQTSRIKRIEIIDNQTIVFHMLNKKAWINRLPFRCPQLYPDGGIVYEVTMGELCNVDMISVVDYPVRCGLGVFEPYNVDSNKGSDGESQDLSQSRQTEE